MNKKIINTLGFKFQKLSSIKQSNEHKNTYIQATVRHHSFIPPPSYLVYVHGNIMRIRVKSLTLESFLESDNCSEEQEVRAGLNFL